MNTNINWKMNTNNRNTICTYWYLTNNVGTRSSKRMLGKYRRSSENIPCFIAIKFELGNYKLYLDRQ